MHDNHIHIRSRPHGHAHCAYACIFNKWIVKFLERLYKKQIVRNLNEFISPLSVFLAVHWEVSNKFWTVLIFSQMKKNMRNKEHCIVGKKDKMMSWPHLNSGWEGGTTCKVLKGAYSDDPV